MATRSIARLFDTSEAARAAVNELETAGFPHDAVTYMGGEDRTAANTTSTGTLAEDRASETGSGTGAATGATLGTVIGGGAGLLAGLGSLAIPGIGPVVAAGWLIAALTGAGVGAAAGGLLGALTSAGLGEEQAETYSEGVRRGGHLVVVRAEEARAAEAERILDRHNPVEMGARAEEWRAGGWTGPRTADPRADSITGANDPALRGTRGDVA